MAPLVRLVRGITVEPAIFCYFLAIYLLFSVFHPTVFNRRQIVQSAALEPGVQGVHHLPPHPQLHHAPLQQL